MSGQPIGTLKAGQTFRTCITKRPGLILEQHTAREGVSVALLDPREECRLSPFVVVEPRDEMEGDR